MEERMLYEESELGSKGSLLSACPALPVPLLWVQVLSAELRCTLESSLTSSALWLLPSEIVIQLTWAAPAHGD